MLKTAEGNITKDIEKSDYRQVNLRRGIDISEEVYSRVASAAHLDEHSHHNLSGNGKVLPVAFKRWENGRMEFLGVPTDIEGFMRIGKNTVKASIPTNPSVTYYSVKLLTPDESSKAEILKAVEKVSDIKLPHLAEERVLGDASMKLVGGEWVGEFREDLRTTKMRIGTAGRKGRIELYAEINSEAMRTKERDETVRVRYTFSKAVQLAKIEIMATSGNYVRIMDKEMTKGLTKDAEIEKSEMFTVEKKFGEGEDRIVADFLTTSRGRLMRIDINGVQYDNFALRPTKVLKGMKEFMAKRNAQEWYTDAVASRWVTQKLEAAYARSIEARELEGKAIKLDENIPFLGHEISSFRFMRNDLVTRAGPYSISVNKNNVTVSWVKGEFTSDKGINILMQLEGDEIVLCEGSKHLSIVADLVMKDGKPYLKALNAKELAILESDKFDVKGGVLSIDEAKSVVSDRILADRHPSLELAITKLRQILEHEADINQAAALYKDAEGLQYNAAIENALKEHLKKSAIPPAEK